MKDKEIIDQLYAALHGLHIACETGPPDIYEWYSSGMFAPAAREKALKAIHAARTHAVTITPPAEAIATLKAEAIAEARQEAWAAGYHYADKFDTPKKP
jgi:hypothetical protein